MKTLRLLALLVAAAMFLVACQTTTPADDNGNGNGDDTPPAITTGSLTVVVQPGNANATIAVRAVGSSTVIPATSGNLWTLEQGNYSVTVTAPDYLTWGPSTYAVSAQGSVQADASLIRNNAVSGNVHTVEIVAFVDEDGNEFEWAAEKNPVKEAILFAAQTEEPVGVIVKVTNAAGGPVVNAPVFVNLTEDYDGVVAIYPGLPSDYSAARVQVSAGVTDATGHVTFTIEATDYHSDFVNEKSGFSVLPAAAVQSYPAKFIVSAVGADNINKRAEFKGFFVNMSHLWYGEAGNLNTLAPSLTDLDVTDTRIGHVFGPFTNVWKNELGADNSHYFGTAALRKQPSSAPFYAGTSFAPGNMVYTMSGDTSMVQWVGCTDVSANGLVCTDQGSAVSLSPKTSVSLDDLPISVTVNAVFVITVGYGDSTYDFDLKNYSFTKEWVGGVLEIDKYVTQHVVTWAGPDRTLKAKNFDNSAMVTTDTRDNYLSTVVLTVTNNGERDYFNVTVRDSLPQELGIVTNSISSGGSYDEVNHTVTWNFNNTTSLAHIEMGESLTFTFDVYARQKPGFARDTSTAGTNPASPVVPLSVPSGSDYADPYCIINGSHFNSVTVAGFYVADDLLASQPVFRYTPVADESTICVVRPVLKLEKKLLSQNVMTQGGSAQYTVSVSQVDRSAATLPYAGLKTLYPWEFGTDSVGTGHRGADYEVRTNTYARNVSVDDRWEVGLDFSNSSNLSNVLAGGVLNTTGAPNKQLSWSAIADLPIGVTSTATIALTGNLISNLAGATPSAQNGANKTITSGLFAWANCSYAYSGQLNQLNTAPNAMLPLSVTDLVTQGKWTASGVGQVLESCVNVTVIPGIVPILGMNVDGEHRSVTPPSGTTAPVFISRTDIYAVGETFKYVYRLENGGNGNALNVDISISALNGSTTLGDGVLYRLSAGTWSINPAGYATIGTDTASIKALTIPVMLPNEVVFFVIDATAAFAGNQTITYTVNYTNPPAIQESALPFVSTDNTTVGPSNP